MFHARTISAFEKASFACRNFSRSAGDKPGVSGAAGAASAWTGTCVGVCRARFAVARASMSESRRLRSSATKAAGGAVRRKSPTSFNLVVGGAVSTLLERGLHERECFGTAVVTRRLYSGTMMLVGSVSWMQPSV